MLTVCPECELQISDKALSCPHCGYPLNRPQGTKKILKKRKRLPNGFGQISEIKGQNLRKPYRAMVTVGKTPDGKLIKKLLKPDAYFATYNEAYAALVEYNKAPYELNDAITIAELYEKWTSEYFLTLKSASSIRTITAAWAYCTELSGMRVMDVRARHIKHVINEGTVLVKGVSKKPSPGVKTRIKSLFNLMLDYAVEYELTDKNYARTFNLSDEIIKEKENAKKSHIAFSDLEMNTLWKNIDADPYVKVIILQCYMGWRPQELGLLELNQVDIINWTITGGMKTEAGIGRTVPVHEKIKAIVKNLFDDAVELGSNYLINCTDAQTHLNSYFMTYDKYKLRFDRIIKALGLNQEHRPHDCRKQFVTMAKKYNVDEYAIKRMVGHSITDITEKIYTERGIYWLQAEINKLP